MKSLKHHKQVYCRLNEKLQERLINSLFSIQPLFNPLPLSTLEQEFMISQQQKQDNILLLFFAKVMLPLRGE